MTETRPSYELDRRMAKDPLAFLIGNFIRDCGQGINDNPTGDTQWLAKTALGLAAQVRHAAGIRPLPPPDPEEATHD